jgi:hypothetical protein
MALTPHRGVGRPTSVSAASLPLLVAAPGTAHSADSATCPANGRTYATNAAGEFLWDVAPKRISTALALSARAADEALAFTARSLPAAR